MIEKLYTIKETAELLRISEQKLYKLMRDNEIKPIKIGDRTLFPEEIIQNFIDSKK